MFNRIRIIVFMLPLIFVFTLGFYVNKLPAANSQDFKAGRIIDDTIFTNSNSMSPDAVQAFLNSKVPNCQAGYTCLKSFSENGKSAAQIIVEKSQEWSISPQVILVLLQKEQSLVLDTWPGANQYTYATGFCVPDGPPPPACDGTYGFTNQVYYAARMFHRIMVNDPAQFTPFPLGNANVNYHPNAGCGAPTIFIENRATQALYAYTPYQPNPAALANLYGTGDGCSAYGNRNFWRLFNDWFGPTTGEGYVLATSFNDNGDPRQWIISKGIKRHVPTTDMLFAWGLDDMPLAQMTGPYLGAIPTAAPLTRLMRPTGTLNVYFVDNARRYRVTSTQMFDVWNQSSGNVLDVPADLYALPTDSGDLGITGRKGTDAAVYLIDSGTKRHITDPNVLAAWAGDTPAVASLSTAYFNSLPSGGDITTAKMFDGSFTYLMDGNRKLKMDNVTLQLYPNWTSHSVTPAIYNLFGTAQLTYVIRAWDSPTQYVVDQGTKHPISDPEILDAWTSSTFPSNTTVTTRGLAGLLSIGTSITDYMASDGSNKYVVEKNKRWIHPTLHDAYTDTRTVYAASTDLLSVFSASSDVNGFIRAQGSSNIYLLTNTGKRRGFINGNRQTLWNEGHPVSELRPNNVARFPDNGGLNAFVTDGTTNYLMAGGQKHVVDASNKSNWGLGTPDTLNDGTLAWFTTGTAITNKLQYNGAYVAVKGGQAYGSVDKNYAEMWAAADGPTLNTALVAEYLSGNMMTRIVKSNQPGDDRLFIIDRGILYRLYPNHAANLGTAGPYALVNPNNFSVQDWTKAVVKDEGGTVYVIDGTTKRPAPAGAIKDQWTNGSSASLPAMTNGFLNTLPTGSQIERAIKNGQPTIYAGVNQKKKWITNPNTYANSYAPYTFVSNALLGVLPDDGPI